MVRSKLSIYNKNNVSLGIATGIFRINIFMFLRFVLQQISSTFRNKIFFAIRTIIIVPSTVFTFTENSWGTTKGALALLGVHIYLMFDNILTLAYNEVADKLPPKN